MTPRSDWGPHYWAVIHTSAKDLPEDARAEDLTVYAKMVRALLLALPCDECRSHAASYIHENPLLPNTREDAMRWGWTFHNAVNARLGKRHYMWKTFTSDAPSPTNRAFVALVLFLVVLLIVGGAIGYRTFSRT